jgi:hypothetical protein
MSQSASLNSVICCCLFGAGSGVLSSWLFAQIGHGVDPPNAQTQTVVPEAPERLQRAPSPESARDPRVSMLEAKVDGLLRSRESGELDTEHRNPESEDLPRLRSERDTRFQKLLDDVNAEPVDVRFSERANLSLASNLRALAKEQSFTVSGLRCHTTRCTANLRWSSFDEATQRFAVPLQHSYDLNCSTHTLLSEPSAQARGEPYESTMVFDCAEALASN